MANYLNGILSVLAIARSSVTLVIGACVVFKFYYFDRCKAWKDNYQVVRVCGFAVDTKFNVCCKKLWQKIICF